MGSQEAATNTTVEGAGHTQIIINNDDMEQIKNEIITKITEVLPSILMEVFPALIEKVLPNIITAVERKTESHISTRGEADRFINENPEKFNECIKSRKQAFEQFQRCESLLLLYNECKEEQPPYIPRKFREDKFHVHDEEELDIVNRRSLANLQCQYDLLSKRKRDFVAKVNHQDDLIFQYVEEMDISREVKVEISKIWQNETKEDEIGIKKVWEKKISEMKKAYEKDKEKLEESNRNRFRDRRNVTVRRGSRVSWSLPALEEQQNVTDNNTDSHDASDQTNSSGLTNSIEDELQTDVIPSVDHDDHHEQSLITSPDEEEDEFGFSNETLARVDDMVNNFTGNDSSHFRDTDRRTIPHDFFGSQMNQQTNRRSTYPRY